MAVSQWGRRVSHNGRRARACIKRCAAGAFTRGGNGPGNARASASSGWAPRPCGGCVGENNVGRACRMRRWRARGTRPKGTSAPGSIQQAKGGRRCQAVGVATAYLPRAMVQTAGSGSVAREAGAAALQRPRAGEVTYTEVAVATAMKAAAVAVKARVEVPRVEGAQQKGTRKQRTVTAVAVATCVVNRCGVVRRTAQSRCFVSSLYSRERQQYNAAR